MTQSPPPERPLGFDEFIAILVAFSTLGTLFFWSLSRGESRWTLDRQLAPQPSPPAASTPLPSPTAGPAFPSPSPQPPPAARQKAPAPPPAPQAAQEQTFQDVPPHFWAYPFIEGLADRGAIPTGDPSFRPDSPVTRAEFANWLQGAFQPGVQAGRREYRDVAEDFWAESEIDRMTGTGFLKGYPGGVFRPEQQVSRVQVLVALASGLKLSPPPSSTAAVQIYRDAAEIPNYGRDPVAAATQEEVVVNYPDPQVLNPQRPATRAEVAAIVYQGLVKAGKAPPVPSPYIVSGK